MFLLLFCLVLGVQSVKEYQEEVPGHEGECKGKDQKFYKLGETLKDEPCVRKICKGTAAPGSVYLEVERFCISLRHSGIPINKDCKETALHDFSKLAEMPNQSYKTVCFSS
ncbi:hypothetical protein RUM43_013998 [Polyplax serrata]|uniref:Uncharacterized protein n=1 Tax=Polyplax serrata TaxID=468196 RepID=A0AAN8NQQ7_POLSC